VWRKAREAGRHAPLPPKCSKTHPCTGGQGEKERGGGREAREGGREACTVTSYM